MRYPSASAAPRIGRGWYLAAVLSAVVALGMCLLGWRQSELADKIGAHPVQVQGTVTRLPGGSGTYSGVSYAVNGQQRTAEDLQLPAGAKVGDPVCLEHAAGDAGAVRVCDQTYPQAAGVRMAQISVPVAVLFCLLCVLRIRRHHRRTARWAERRNQVFATVALATEALAEGMPAITDGKRSRRRHKAARRPAR
ncbi:MULTISPECIES: hypothetical protein [Kitasatospora]|uniref:hypothetical protein n=1 Tax=Kitasatospora TaxID=2063 RepID=UPI000CAA54B3|nr:hypothetical protein [Kitasatospora sp. GP30]MDH6141252.1 hypothetical protein [Kitasatospora sp. GP30]